MVNPSEVTMAFDQLPIALATAEISTAGADTATAAVAPTPQAAAMAVNVQVSAYADPLASGPATCVVQTAPTGSSDWYSLPSSRNTAINGTGSFSIDVVDPILDKVRVLFDVTGHNITAVCTFLSDVTIAAA